MWIVEMMGKIWFKTMIYICILIWMCKFSVFFSSFCFFHFTCVCNLLLSIIISAIWNGYLLKAFSSLNNRVGYEVHKVNVVASLWKVLDVFVSACGISSFFNICCVIFAICAMIVLKWMSGIKILYIGRHNRRKDRKTWTPSIGRNLSLKFSVSLLQTNI